MYGILQVLIFTVAFSCCHSHAIWETPGELHPVHGLYVKPSSDGTTGDLYVAATEENGVQTQWLTDQSVNFLPAATSLQPKTVPLSSSLAKTSMQENKTTAQKRAIITSPAVKYAYALPIPGAEGNVASYPYAIPATVTAPSEGSAVIPPCSTDIPVQPYPYQYYYPPMMSAIASALNSHKENESNEEKTPVASPSPFWPQAYGYPYQYVFIDPNTWVQSQANASEGPSSSESA